MADAELVQIGRLNPALLPLNDIRELLSWYRLNLCNAAIEDRRGFRVRFLETNFIHLIKLKTKYGEEPKNARLALEEIERGRIKLVEGRYDRQRASELSWIRRIASDPWKIVSNWQALGHGDEAFIRNFGTEQMPIYRVLVCEVVGTIRQPVTVFPRERIGEKELGKILWP